VSINPGAIVMVRQYGAALWVVRAKRPVDFWDVVGKRRDAEGSVFYTHRTVGTGDVSIVQDPTVYEAGTPIDYDGMQCTVVADNGDTVELVLPARSYPTRGDEAVRYEAGNTITVHKADLALELMQ
jgi:hypothetical protein